jgi:hypothetical protein
MLGMSGVSGPDPFTKYDIRRKSWLDQFEH